MTPADYLKKPYGRTLVPESDGTFRAEIVEFPGCIATGGTAQDAYTNLEDVAESWLAATIARGQRVPDPVEDNPYSGKFVARLPKSLHRKAAVQAARDGVSLNQFVVTCIAEQVGARASAATTTVPALQWGTVTGNSINLSAVFLSYPLQGRVNALNPAYSFSGMGQKEFGHASS